MHLSHNILLAPDFPLIRLIPDNNDNNATPNFCSCASVWTIHWEEDGDDDGSGDAKSLSITDYVAEQEELKGGETVSGSERITNF